MTEAAVEAKLLAEIARLAAMSEAAYEAERHTAAKELGVRASFLDKQSMKIRGDRGAGLQGRPLQLPDPEPWSKPVKGRLLLAGLTGFFTAHAHLPEWAASVLALWTVHAHCADAFQHTPRLNIRAATKGSGKSTVLDLLQMVVPRPLLAADVTPAVLFRLIEMARATVLIDEGDVVLDTRHDGGAKELCSVLNAGHMKGGQAVRCVGEDQTPRAFNAFAPTAIAGIGGLPGTLADRSIVIGMERAKRGEIRRPIRPRTRRSAERLARLASRWAADNAAGLADSEPDMGRLFNRTADVWRPLYAIAEAVGNNWPDLVRKASAALAPHDDDASLGEQLLADIRDVFNDEGNFDWIGSQHLVEQLIALEGRPWAELGEARRPLTKNLLARLLKQFKVKPCCVGPQEGRLRGYRRAAFADVFARQLSC
jgi:putative DNA primase/helicase